nr:hypothetical protein [Ottowia massiliensis]
MKVFKVNETVAGVAKSFGRFFIAESICDESIGAYSGGQGREIAVAGNQAETIKSAAVEQVHRVDDQFHIRRVLAFGIGELLHGHDGVP